jgi:nitrite reductase/ring-hydroxylating ferredoxin subunit
VARLIKVCELEEVPPGRGKVVRVGHSEAYIYNREGRIVATLEQTSASGRVGGLVSGDVTTSCRHPGSHFEVEQEDSPARARAHSVSLEVRVAGDGIYLALDDCGEPRQLPPLGY